MLCRALAQDAPLLLLDEPTTSLDLGRQQQALELVAALREQRELTVISAMHDITLAAQYADRLLLLADGRLVADGAPGGDRHGRAHRRSTTARTCGSSAKGGSLAVIPVRRQ